ncbi:MAG: recombinase family protein [Lachnospira sp.]
MQYDKYVVGYERLSKDDPDSIESSSILYQKMIIADYVKNHPELSDYEYTERWDDGYSGTNLERPGIQEVLRLVKENKVYCIVVKDLSRFSRDYIDIQKYLERIFPTLDVRFISIADKFDSNEYIGNPLEMAMKFKSILADYYCKDTSDKIINQLSAKKAQGKFIAGSAPFGYSKSKEDKYKLVIEPREAEVVRRIFDLALNGLNINQIARQLNDEGVPTPREFEQMKRKINREAPGGRAFWYARSVHSILTNEAYIGTMTYNKYRQRSVGSKRKVLIPSSEWERIYNNHEPIISKEDFEEVQRRYTNNTKTVSKGSRDKNKESYPLIGKLYCGGCKRALSRNRFVPDDMPLVCNTRSVTDQFDCYEGDSTMREIEEVVLYQIRKHIKEVLALDLLTGQEMMNYSDQINRNKEEISEAQEHLASCDERLQELLVQKHRDRVTTVDFLERKTLLDVERKSLLDLIHEKEQEIHELKQALSNAHNKEQEIASYGDLESLSPVLVNSLIDKIYLYSGMKMNIIWKNN